ncbi:MAG: AlpA family phage regulatory protein [Rhizobiales bacterium]|nr:AlpA family phage regulatory protein [Hyphomicrobiales bacterium]OJX98914.1 MAG: hypothetical protein BGP07_13125 [Rhizobiales bacterium 63-22]
MNGFENERLIRLDEVERLVGLKHSTIYLLIQSGEFPRQIPVTKRSVRWRLSEIQRWIEERAALAA